MFALLAQSVHSLGADTLVPVGTFIICAIVVGGLLVKIIRRFDRIETRLDDMDKRTAEEWTLKDQQIFALKMQIKNPTIDVPDCVEIARGNRPSTIHRPDPQD